ncbi:hypothetical protein E2P81_ATG10926 [Venturia nashicola]|nr:hypothetical protein E2P81_ATG10926 [Venturia nashicola]
MNIDQYSDVIGRDQSGEEGRPCLNTTVYTQDPELAVHKHQVEWFEDGKKQFNLIKWTEITADGNKEHRQGFVYVEHLNQHVDYRPQIEDFEQEQMKAVYGDKDRAARQKQEAAEKKERITVEKLLKRILEGKPEEELRMRKCLAE